ncbi:transposase [Rhodococcus opacus]|nr:hypothetical protein COO55_23715 [Rhodococcus opacus]RZK94158.1 MAG: hypothetical protein EOP30_08720 [Rhodococcus sp. (in: high G+C Gram-positive bacteria)]
MLIHCEEIMAEGCDKFGVTLTECNGDADHVHLLIHHPPASQRCRGVSL